MSGWGQLFYLLGIALAGWMIWRTIKHRPEMFTRANLGKSLTTLGVLALILIAFIMILVWMVKL